MSVQTKEEIWKPIAGYHGLYDVSSLGRVRSYHTLGRKRRPTSRRKLSDPETPYRMLKPIANNYGYLKVTLRKDQTSTQCVVSHLVLAAFSVSHRVCYLDGDKTNLAASNLSYGLVGEAIQRNR